MASLVHDTVAWLRFYSRLPIPSWAGASGAEETSDLAGSAHGVPVAGAALGAVGGIVLMVAWGLRLPSFLAATFAVAALMIATGALSERCLTQTIERLAGDDATRTAGPVGVYGALAVVIALLLRVGAIDGLVAFGSFKAALALVAACAVSRAAALSMMSTFASKTSASETSGRFGINPLQRLALVALAIGVIAVLPTYGVSSAVAGLAAAVAAAAAVMTVASRLSADDERPLAGAAEQTAEIAFLVAVLIFARAG